MPTARRACDARSGIYYEPKPSVSSDSYLRLHAMKGPPPPADGTFITPGGLGSSAAASGKKKEFLESARKSRWEIADSLIALWNSYSYTVWLA